jgi:hypothetical protein
MLTTAQRRALTQDSLDANADRVRSVQFISVAPHPIFSDGCTPIAAIRHVFLKARVAN